MINTTVLIRHAHTWLLKVNKNESVKVSPQCQQTKLMLTGFLLINNLIQKNDNQTVMRPDHCSLENDKFTRKRCWKNSWLMDLIQWSLMRVDHCSLENGKFTRKRIWKNSWLKILIRIMKQSTWMTVDDWLCSYFSSELKSTFTWKREVHKKTYTSNWRCSAFTWKQNVHKKTYERNLRRELLRMVHNNGLATFTWKRSVHKKTAMWCPFQLCRRMKEKRKLESETTINWKWDVRR